MKKNILSRIKRFILDSYKELLQCVWPERAHLFESTILVVVVIFILAAFVFVVDKVGAVAVGGITTGHWGF